MEPIGDDLWIGLHDITNEGHFEWIDGSAALSYTNWYPGSPDNYYRGEDCVNLLAKGVIGRWVDRECNNTFYFICKKLPVVVPEEACHANVTQHMDLQLTWPQTAVGELAWSNEKCSLGTSRVGWPLAGRLCNISTGSGQAEWDSPHMLGCSAETTDSDIAQEGVEIEELCPANVTLGIDGNFTWTQTAVGKIAFSKEICSSATSRVGWPLAFRFCNVSLESPEQIEWGAVHVMSCSEDIVNVAPDEEELCPANVTLSIDGNLTWTQTAVGELAFSIEKCSSATSKAGWPLAFRFCNVSSDSPEQVEWGSVHVLSCSEDSANISTDEGYCPDGWDSYGAYCYFVNGEHRVSFNDAVFECQNLTSNVTSIHSEDEQYYHMLILRKTATDLWIGLHGSNDERSLDWVDGSPYDYESWTPISQHDNRSLDEDCVYLHSRSSGHWNINTCNSLLGYICKKPKVALDGYCTPDMTVLEAGGTLTWPEAPIGTTALSEETCGPNTDNSGRAIGLRYCRAIYDDVYNEECVSREQQIKACVPHALGMKSRAIPDSMITASSYLQHRDWDRLPQYARLGEHRAWASSGQNSDHTWIQVELRTNHLLTGLQTEGNNGNDPWNYWVETFQLKTATTRHSLSYVTDTNGYTKSFQANVGERSVANITLDNPVMARFIRIYPTKCMKGHDVIHVCVVRFELIGCETTTIIERLTSSPIPSAATNLSKLNQDTAILEQCPENWHGHSGYCYYISDTKANFNGARDSCSNQHSSLASIHSVGEQVFLQGLTGDTNTHCFIGLHDSFVEGDFQWIDETEYNYNNWAENEPNNGGPGEDCVVLIGTGGGHRQGWWNDVRCSLSLNFICKKRAICNFALGMESGRIVDSQLSASSMRDPLSGPTRARFNQSRDGFLRGAWTAILNGQDQDQWIQVMFFRDTVVTAVITQGRDEEEQWVTRYSVEYTQDGSTWIYIKEQYSNRIKAS
ncbi:C-type mannose receptor 2-like [Amphiura filiformis]|uniref:C-type mannose receptor 2-like n=1 Tax=Amphiura filiformis TaxID=82378 RepID=UPI003B21B1D0